MLSLRLGNVYGPHEAVCKTRQRRCFLSRPLAEARDKGMITVKTPKALREWSWLRDLGRAIAWLIVGFLVELPTILRAGSPPTQIDLGISHAILDRLGGTAIRLAPPPHILISPPMASAMASVFDAIRWTTLDATFYQLIRAKAAP